MTVRRSLVAVFAVLALAPLGACATAMSPTVRPDGDYAAPIGGSRVTSNPTPYSEALVCLAYRARVSRIAAPSVAVGRINDYTGALDPTGSGSARVTQGAALMAMTAFGKAGFPLVERFDTAVSALEVAYDGQDMLEKARSAGPEIPRSDYYLVGGITELNADIRTSSADLNFAKRGEYGAGHQVLVMNVGVDLRLIDTRTLRVVDLVSYQKQVVAKQVGVDLFDGLSGGLFKVSAGSGANEPLQLVVRSLIERGVAEMGAGLYRMPGAGQCLAVADDNAGRRAPRS